MELSFHFINDVLPKRPYLTLELLENIINTPTKTEIQEDGRIKYWGYSSEYKKYIRVIVLEDGKTILTAFFDRNFKL